MKIFSVICVAMILVAGIAVASWQHREARDKPGPPTGDPIFQLLDTDKNGELSMKEIESAVAILKKRDRDGNGVLTPDELPRPPRPGEDRARRDDEPRAKQSESATKGTVVISGGHETDARDHGRPVSLIAAALGVKPEVFRDAFSKVNPSRGGDPSPVLARTNKKVLMDALSKHGISNEQLDTVSNYYRYNGSRGEVWKQTPATATPIIKDGKVTGFKITNPGSGYSSPPGIRVVGFDVKVKATIGFSQDFKTNGRLTSLTVIDPEEQALR